MLTKYFPQGINTQKYSNVFKKDVFSPMLVVCLFRDLTEMSEAVCETGTSPAEKAEQERKWSQSIYALMLRALGFVSLAGKAKLSLEVKM